MTSADELLREAAARPVEGWDFSWLGERLVTEPLPWSFEALVAEAAADSPDLLDLGTGGGEWLAALPHRPPRTVATESYPPNVDVAGRTLRPLGVTVVAVEEPPENVEQRPGETRGRLPFPSESFALVCDRHTSFVAAEVARVLVPGGRFLTQQVGGDYGDFHEALGLPRPPRPTPFWDLARAREQVAAAGLDVVRSAESAEVTRFADVGALAWYLRAIPWTVPGFAVETHRPHLERAHERIARDGPLAVRLPAFWLEAVRPASGG